MHTEKTGRVNRENTRRRQKFQNNTNKWKFEAFSVIVENLLARSVHNKEKKSFKSLVQKQMCVKKYCIYAGIWTNVFVFFKAVFLNNNNNARLC